MSISLWSSVHSGAKLFARQVVGKTICAATSRSSTRKLLNDYYNILSDETKARWQRRYAKIFSRSGLSLAAGDWSVIFLDSTIRLPLRPQHSWLDWDNAISILGAEIDIKKFYARIIKSSERPELFVDVGASYGTHSLLFASAGIRAIAFEPNPRCAEYSKIASDLNGFDIRWQQIAIGDRDDVIELTFPERDTWVGSVSESVARELLGKYNDVCVERAPIRKLDHYTKELQGKRVLIKIDVEGEELAVLRGASTILKETKPSIIFESFESSDDQSRSDVFELFAKNGYVVMLLSGAEKSLTKDEFCGSSANNFFSRYCDPIEPQECFICSG